MELLFKNYAVIIKYVPRPIRLRFIMRDVRDPQYYIPGDYVLDLLEYMVLNNIKPEDGVII